jgi:uncharacterized membrane protein
MPKIEYNMTAAQSRWRSKVLWAAIIIQLIVIADVVGLWSLIGLEKTTFTIIADAVLQVLVLVGVINNPTDSEGW